MLNSLLQKVEQMEPICPKQDGMVCRVCGQRKYLRKEWFNPQWQEWSPVVLGHQGGDFDRCEPAVLANHQAQTKKLNATMQLRNSEHKFKNESGTQTKIEVTECHNSRRAA